ncbi:hypothetical protein CVT24_000902 [Panaeolus cyanescens]|uniref:P-loop containing nucleoside triphosphate hydrolase protein n=1 Tax=Panaeolus cyanescens TaxID=181874 RepID=A0A409YY28_9AGAR|nr:hypothetical protein CVT24_000902 [Panaeolus cyanescens]
MLWNAIGFQIPDSRFIPLAVSACCAASQSVQFIRKIHSPKASRPSGMNPFESPPPERVKDVDDSNRGPAMTTFYVVRLIGSLILLGLFCATFVQHHVSSWTWLDVCKSPEMAVIITLTYSAFLSLSTFSFQTKNKSTSRYNDMILLALSSVYVSRDLWPLATTYQVSKDAREGWFMWAKVSLLLLVGVIIPLFAPRNWSSSQNASIFSRALFSSMNPLVSQGYRAERLTRDKIPPLAADDRTRFQTERAFPRMSPFYGGKRRHLVYGLFSHFRKDYTILSGIVVLMTLSGFAAPIGINQLLVYIESQGHATKIKPWFWVMWLFLGPFSHSLITQQYFNITRRTQVRIELLITQLVFEHALRIRLEGDTSTTQQFPQDSFAEDAPESVAEERVQDDGNLENVRGMINTLVTSDVANITGGRDFLLLFIYVPLQLMLCMSFLFRLLGWSAFVGLATILVLFPIPGYITKALQEIQSDKMKKTDARLETVTEAINVVRMVKMFGWERKMTARLQERRDSELAMLKKYKILDTLNGLLSFLLPTITMLVTVAVYTLFFHHELKPSIIFPSMALFAMLREQMQRIAWDVSMIVQAKVSLNRVNDFLRNSELLDVYLHRSDNVPNVSPHFVPFECIDAIGFNNASFTWVSNQGADSPSRQAFKLKVDGRLLFKKGAISLITGQTGAGKTSMLMALLGEMHFLNDQPDSWFNLPRAGGVAYAAQESWVQNDTIKNNILFGSPYDEVRYRKVIKQCALEQDLNLFAAGDETEVGERGLTLSGGQKARITLARAVYSQANILLLDDVFAALDGHTANWIVRHCLGGELIKGRTVLLVTHNLPLLEPVADAIVTVGRDISMTSSRPLPRDESNLTQSFSSSALEHPKDAVNIVQDEDMEERNGAIYDGKLVMEEEVATGHITWRSMKLLFNGFGGNHPMLFFIACILGLAVTDLSSTFQMWFLGYWTTQYEMHDPSEVKSGYYLVIYGTLMVGAFVIYSATHLFFVFASLKASRMIHESLIGSIFTSTFRWLDETPTGRMISRCTQDINAIDGPIPQLLMWCLEPVVAVITKLTVIVLFSPAFFIPASLRAYGVQEAVIAESMNRIDDYTTIARTSYDLHRWVSIRIEGLGAVFTAALAAYLVYGQPISASNTGFSLTIAVEFSTFILWVVMIFNDFEVESNSLERIQGYLDIDHEPHPTKEGLAPAAWPTSGELIVDKLSARYSETGPKVLQDISFHVKSGERIGIVGRTGSGKSSLALAILRCMITEGKVLYDGIQIDGINVDLLRSKITIIPQIPELISGTLRQNLDPFEQNDDAVLSDALNAAGLFSLEERTHQAHLTLDSNISGGGSNLSVGQRQIIALARAILRRSKLLILDEATSSIDHHTDAVIQHALRHQLPKDVTVITIAHRMENVMDADKILVLEAGRLVEFGTPTNLLNIRTGLFRRLVEESGPKEALKQLSNTITA